MNKKALIFIFIHVFVAVQLALPLHYYLGRSDQNDERFAWRMFSPVRMLRCRPVFRVGEEQEPVRRLGAIFHEAWITLARRGRLEVVTAMGKKLCEGNPGEPDRPVRSELTCTTVKGETQTYGGAWDICSLESL